MLEKSIKPRLGTVIAAARWEDADGVKVIIGADTQVTFGHRKGIIDPNIKSGQKLITFDSFAIGVCGAGPIREILHEMQKDKNKLHMEMTGEESDDEKIQEFVREAYSNYREHLEQSPVGPSYEEDYLHHIGGLLIVTRYKIYSVYPDFTFFSVPTFAANGCGCDLAVGAMHVLYENLSEKKNVTWEDLHNVVHTGLSVACAHSVYCSEPLHILEMRDNPADDEVVPKRKAPRRTKRK